MRPSVVVFVVSLTAVASHPGNHAEDTSQGRSYFLERSRRSISNCADSRESRELAERTAIRRESTIQSLRTERAEKTGTIWKRDTATVLAKNHKSSLTGISSSSANQDSTVLFPTSPICLLMPEVTAGPFYVLGEMIRSDVRETQQGVSLIIDMQIVDIHTCKPVPNSYVEIWHANATGVYSGIVNGINGNSADTSNINTTFLRGVQLTDSDGVVQFHTSFPAYYPGRTSHIHAGVHLNAVAQPNNTITGGTVAHVGQVFWDQNLINQIGAIPPYTGNLNTQTTNADDSIFVQESAAAADPVPEYVLLGSSLTDGGLFAWITIGVDTSLITTIPAASILTAAGGVQNGNGGMGNGGGCPPGGGMGGGPGGNATGEPGSPPPGGNPGGPGGNMTGGGGPGVPCVNTTGGYGY